MQEAVRQLQIEPDGTMPAPPAVNTATTGKPVTVVAHAGPKT